jgi:hypothetical protein
MEHESDLAFAQCHIGVRNMIGERLHRRAAKAQS